MEGSTASLHAASGIGEGSRLLGYGVQPHVAKSSTAAHTACVLPPLLALHPWHSAPPPFTDRPGIGRPLVGRAKPCIQLPTGRVFSTQFFNSFFLFFRARTRGQAAKPLSMRVCGVFDARSILTFFRLSLTFFRFA